MIEDTNFRTCFVAYFYSLFINPEREKFLIQEKNALNPREYKIYSVLAKLIEKDEEINKATVSYDMQLQQLTGDFHYIISTAEKERFDTTCISKYYNILHKEYILDLFRSAKSDAQIQAAVDKLQDIQELTNNSLISIEDAIENYLNSPGTEILETGLECFDKNIGLSSGIVLMAGCDGSGKSSLVVELIKRILLVAYNKKKISILWYSMEDNLDTIIAKFVSKEMNVPVKKLSKDSSKFKNNPKYKSLRTFLESFNIEFYDKGSCLHEIKLNWKTFLKKEKKLNTEFPILIIDNLMLLDENADGGNQTAIDDKIARGLYSLSNEAKKVFGNKHLIFALHHINKEAGDKDNAKNAYLPTIRDIKGSGRLRDVAKVIILVHWFGVKNNLHRELEPFVKYLRNVMYIQCVKNREGGFMGDQRIWMNLDYNFAADYMTFEEKKNAV